MHLDLSEEQTLLRRQARAFLNERSPVSRFRHLRDGDLGYEPSLFKEMAALGFLKTLFPESAGGLGTSFVETALVLEELGRVLCPEPVLPSLLGAYVVFRAGSQAQHERFLKPVLDGERSLALAYAERESRYDLDRCETYARKEDGAFVLTGEKVWVQNGHAAEHIVVSAMHREWLQLFIVERESEGVRIERVRTLDGRYAARIELDDVRVSPEHVLAQEPALELLEHTLDYAAAAAVCEGVGVCARALELTADHLTTRKQFGQPLSRFQALSHQLADMHVETELLRSSALEAAASVDAKSTRERRVAISAAKAMLTESGVAVCQRAIQLHGGMGVSDEHDIGLYLKRMRVLAALYGDEDHHLGRFLRNASAD